LKIWSHQHHKPVYDYSRGDYKLNFARQFDESYARLFEDVPLMVNDLYLTLVYNPVGDVTQKLFAKFDRPSNEDLHELKTEAIATLEDRVDQVMGMMKSYGIEQLGIYYRDKWGNIIRDTTDDGIDDEPDDDDDLLALEAVSEPAKPSNIVEPAKQHAFSSALEWLSFLANGEWGVVPVCRDQIRSYLMRNRPVSSIWGDVIQIRTIDHN